MGDAGILTEDDRVELLDGWLVCRVTKSPRRAATIDLLRMRLAELVPAGWFVRAHGAIVLADSVPVPDVVVVRGKPGDYRRRHPTVGDVGLIGQVADGSAAFDRAKADIIARADIPHYWIVNLDDNQVEVFSQPTGSGRKRVYRQREVLRAKSQLDVILDGQTIGSLPIREILG